MFHHIHSLSLPHTLSHTHPPSPPPTILTGRAWHAHASSTTDTSTSDALHELLTLALSALRDQHTHIHDAAATAMADLGAVLASAGQHGLVLKLVHVLLEDVKVWGWVRGVGGWCHVWA